jgi:hypothetical protein
MTNSHFLDFLKAENFQVGALFSSQVLKGELSSKKEVKKILTVISINPSKKLLSKISLPSFSNLRMAGAVNMPFGVV